MFSTPSESDRVLTNWSESLGLMLYDIRFNEKGNLPGFFQAEIINGVLNCDTEGDKPIRIYGWDIEGGAA
jgi:hypothetical protein